MKIEPLVPELPLIDGRIEVNFLCNLGYGDPASVLPRAPRLEFEEVCKFA